MPGYRSPGTYVEEIPAAVQPIAGVGTSTAGFIGIVPDTVLVPRPNPHHNPSHVESAVSEIQASDQNLLGKTLAQDIGLTTQVTLPGRETGRKPGSRCQGGGWIGGCQLHPGSGRGPDGQTPG